MEFNPLPAGIFLSHLDVPRPIDWHEQFGNLHPLHLEIGFGFGEFLLRQAELPIAENFIGVEQDWSRLCKCLTRISTLRSQGQKKDFGCNLRLLRADVHVALERLFRPCSLSRVTCLFPCPWPKKAHVKYRLFSRDFLVLLNSRVQENAKVNIVTDWQPYLQWVLEEIEGSGFSYSVKKIKSQYDTKFERKWKAGGQEDFWELVLTKSHHYDRPIEEDVELRACFVKEFNPERFRFENETGPVSVVYKDFVFDPQRMVGLVKLIVAEKFLTQYVWVAVIKTKDQWCIAKADGHSALPTAGVALAIAKVSQAVERTTDSAGQK